jgi:hypothetical protein
MKRIVLSAIIAGACFAAPAADISSVPADLTPPPMTAETPGSGRRVKQVAPEYSKTEVYHALYLPTDWQPGRRYPVLVEYAGNGPYRNHYGYVSSGRVEGSNLGYGMSAGKGFIWVCMPYVNAKEKANQTLWWGDVDATLAYCRNTIRRVCEDYGGDPSAIVLAGFSRGAIGCGYLGLHDQRTADIWLAFVAYSHFDGVRETWGYAGADRASALQRLKRLQGRAVFVCSEDNTDSTVSLSATRRYLETSGVVAPFTFQATPFQNHSDAWVLRPSPAREALREWLREVLQKRFGAHSVCGRVSDANGLGLMGVRVESGYTHFAFTDASGRYELRSLIDGRRAVTIIAKERRFTPMERPIVLAGSDLTGIDFVKME